MNRMPQPRCWAVTDDFQFAGIGQPVFHRHAALDAPQVHQLHGELSMEPVGGFFGSDPVAGKDGQEILHHHLAALSPEKKIKLGHDYGKALHQSDRQNPHDGQPEPPQAGAVEGGRCRRVRVESRGP